MSNYFGEDRETQIVGGGYGGYGYGGGYGGVGAIIALVVVVAILWFLSREGKESHHSYGGYPYAPYPPFNPYGGNCGPLDCKIPMTPDLSNCDVDRDVLKCCCEEKEATHCEGEKTRALIEQNYIQDLRDKLAAANSEKSALESKFFTEKKFDQLSMQLAQYDNQVDRQFCKTDGLIKEIMCEIPKRPPIFCEGTTPNTHHIDCHDRFEREFPHRRRFEECCCE